MTTPILPPPTQENAITTTMQYQVETVKLLNHIATSLETIARDIATIANKQP